MRLLLDLAGATIVASDQSSHPARDDFLGKSDVAVGLPPASAGLSHMAALGTSSLLPLWEKVPEGRMRGPRNEV
ncbi:hypothetical protein ASC89_22350 [Devosia sp. Root413D1]|nr:hypothetical protein ASC89_22350 [Devosia sp. Root413D1]